MVKLSPSRYEVRCDCGWKHEVIAPVAKLAKENARQAAWNHWAAHPV